MAETPASFMLQANPKYYDLTRALRDGLTTISWTLKTHFRKIKKGDELFFWVSGPDGGLVGVGQAAADPSVAPAVVREASADPYSTGAVPRDDSAAVYTVPVEIRHVPPSIIPRSVFTAHPFLGRLEVLRFANATSFTVRPDEAEELRARLRGETIDQRRARYFLDFKRVGPEWFGTHRDAFLNHDFFLRFARKEHLEKAEWPDFQALGEHVRAFASRPVTRSRALGSPNHPIERYRQVFLRLLHDEATPVEERIRRFLADEEFSVAFFPKAAFEIVGQLFPDRFFVVDDRSREALPLLDLPSPRKRGDSPADEYFETTRLLEDLLPAYRHAAGRLSDLPARLELDQFVSYLAERFRRDPSEAEDSQLSPDRPQVKRYWGYAPGAGAIEFDRFWKEGVMAIGWDKLGDLRQYPGKKEMLSRLNELYPGDTPRTGSAFICHAFRSLVSPGDVVFVKKGTKRLLGYGVVSGDYEFHPERGEMPHVRTIDWKLRGDWPLEDLFAIKTLTNITDYPEFVQKLLEIMGVEASSPAPGPAPDAATASEAPYGIDEILDESFEPEERVRAALDLLASRKNLVLQGPPGTGKTHLARQLAWALTGSRTGERVELVQFHQGYSYEDFVQGFRPDEENRLALRSGLFLRFCARARVEPSKPFVLVIDEINRGNISRIFGELLLALEPDKRDAGWKVRLAYDGSPTGLFFVPPNLHVIATMNTADRSLAMVDFALRRRFAFFTLDPLFGSPEFREHLASLKIQPSLIDKITVRLGSLNDLISKDTRSLGPGYQIGHSYFTNPPEVRSSGEAWYQEVVENQIAPLLREYWFEEFDKARRQIDQLLA